MERSASRIAYVPGRVFINPTDLGIDPPYGGTELGLSRGGEFQPLLPSFEVWAEEFASVVEAFEAAHDWFFATFLRGFDPDALAAVFPNTEVGAQTQKTVVTYPGTREPGRRVTQRAVTMLYAPLNPIDHPALLLYRALPLWAETQAMALNRPDESALPVAFRAVLDDSRRIWSMGPMWDIEYP